MLSATNLSRFVLVLAVFVTGSFVLADGPGDIMAQLVARFNAWDTNKDDAADKAELVKAIGEVKANATLARYDTNKDGKLSRDEYMVWAKAYAAELKAREGGDRPREGKGRG